MIDEELTPTSVTTIKTTVASDQEHEPAAVSTDEDEENLAVEQPNSPTHTVSSSNGHDTVRCFLC